MRAFMMADTQGSGSVLKRDLFLAMELVGITGLNSAPCLQAIEQANDAVCPSRSVECELTPLNFKWLTGAEVLTFG